MNAEERIAKLKRAAESLPCGKRAKFIAGCRCEACHEANRVYMRALYRRRKAGDLNPIVSAAPARAHIRKLSKQGVGNRSIADIVGIQVRRISAIRNGTRKKLRKKTVDAILSIDKTAATGRALIDATDTWKLLDELVERGYSKAQLGRWLHNTDLQVAKDRVTADLAARVKKLVVLLNSGKLKRE